MFAALPLLLIGLPAVAQDMGEKLYGSWRLVSFKAQIVGEDAEPRDIFGPAPGVNSYWQYLATGVILVLALALGMVSSGNYFWTRAQTRD
jgi:hypothetical protein